MLLFLSFRIGKQFFSDAKLWLIPSLFVARFGMALFFLYVYTYYYGGGELTADAGRFFSEAKELQNVFFKNASDFFQLMFGITNNKELASVYLGPGHHWFADYNFTPMDSRNVIRVNALLLFISNGSILVHFLILTFISFLGVLDVSLWLKKETNIPLFLLVCLLALIPGVSFWSSSILKEPIMMFGFAVLLRAVFDHSLNNNARVLRYLLGIASMLLFKPYVLLIFAPFVLYKLIISPIFKTNIWSGVLLSCVIGFFLLVFTGLGSFFVDSISTQQKKFIDIKNGGIYLEADDAKYYYLLYDQKSYFQIQGNEAKLLKPVKALKVRDHNEKQHESVELNKIGKTYPLITMLSVPGSGVHVTPIMGDPSTMLKMIPEALFNTTIRPLPSEGGNWLKFLAHAENVLLLIASFVIIVFFRRQIKFEQKSTLIALALFTLVMLLIVGWTTPVVGAIVRYKIPAYFTFVITLLLLFDWEKLKKRCSFFLE